jgi:predicted lipid-binding transport protein (Tim44 family)
MNFSYLKSVAIVAITSTILLSGTVVEAKKMGGGMSIGRQSNTITKNQNALPPKPVAPPVNAAPKPVAPNPATPQAPAPSRFGGMGGILGGIAAGIGLSYLFSHLGMGAEMGSMFSSLLIVIAIALIGMWLFRKLMSRNASSPSLSTGIPGMNFQQSDVSTNAGNYSQASAPSSASPLQTMPTSNQMPLIPEPSQTNLPPSVQANLTPNSFADKENFLENAKKIFLQLQEASDQQNIDVLKEYTSPELFAELRKDMLSRTTAISYTQVLTLAADLLAVEEENHEYLASVRFSGSLREELNGPVEEFAEVWNWSKPMDSSTGWILCGIQQIN